MESRAFEQLLEKRNPWPSKYTVVSESQLLSNWTESLTVKGGNVVSKQSCYEKTENLVYDLAFGIATANALHTCAQVREFRPGTLGESRALKGRSEYSLPWEHTGFGFLPLEEYSHC